MDSIDTVDLNGFIGTEVCGLKLVDASDNEIRELTDLVAERGVLVIRDQEMTVAQQHDVGSRFGRLVGGMPSGAVPDFPTVKIVHTDEHTKRAVGDGWHSDRPVVESPPALSILRVEQVPSVGGETAYASMYEAFSRLSDSFQDFLCGLTAVFSGERYRDSADPSGESLPSLQEHPAVRTHPVTGRKALYVSPVFTSHIKELSPRESEAVLKMLYDHIAYGVEFQVRIRWKPHTVAIWDNRCVQHHAIWDFWPETRHGYRVTTEGEPPFLRP